MTLRLGVPNKGRLNERTIELLTRAGINLGDGPGRRLYIKAQDQDIEVMFLRAQDIPELVAKGALDLGITGMDQVAESGYELINLLNLEFGYCHLAVAVPEESDVRSIADIPSGSRIATSFPNCTRRFFEAMGKDVKVINVSGAAEIMPHIGVSDYIVDLVSTGSTLKMNRLVEVGTIVESQAAVFSSKEYCNDLVEVESIVEAIRSVIVAEGKKYLMANVPKDKMETIREIIPGLEGPTILDIVGTSDYVSVHVVVDSKKIFQVISELKAIGATGILTTQIERLVV